MESLQKIVYLQGSEEALSASLLSGEQERTSRRGTAAGHEKLPSSCLFSSSSTAVLITGISLYQCANEIMEAIFIPGSVQIAFHILMTSRLVWGNGFIESSSFCLYIIIKVLRSVVDDETEATAMRVVVYGTRACEPRQTYISDPSCNIARPTFRNCFCCQETE